MSTFSLSKLRIFILLILSICISLNSVAMASELSESEMPVMNNHCMGMMEDMSVSIPDMQLSDHHEKETCASHYACFGLELRSFDLSISVAYTITLTTQIQSPYTQLAALGYFALPDPPPRFT